MSLSFVLHSSLMLSCSSAATVSPKKTHVCAQCSAEMQSASVEMSVTVIHPEKTHTHTHTHTHTQLYAHADMHTYAQLHKERQLCGLGRQQLSRNMHTGCVGVCVWVCVCVCVLILFATERD